MNDRPDRVHRRVDLIFSPWSVYWTAVVGWLVTYLLLDARFDVLIRSLTLFKY